jgi:hypothetical protein
VLAAAALLASAPDAWACNACVEDKIAATYDWQVVQQARRVGHTVVYAAIQGAVTPGDDAFSHRLLERLAHAAGVDAGSVRVSLAPPAVSFACDLRRRTAADAMAVANRALQGMRIGLALVRAGAPASPTPVTARSAP